MSLVPVRDILGKSSGNHLCEGKQVKLQKPIVSWSSDVWLAVVTRRVHGTDTEEKSGMDFIIFRE